MSLNVISVQLGSKFRAVLAPTRNTAPEFVLPVREQAVWEQRYSHTSLRISIETNLIVVTT